VAGTFTQLAAFLSCEHAMYRRYIKKDLGPYVQSPEAKFGEDVHKAFERRIGSCEPLPDGVPDGKGNVVDLRQWECFAAPFDGLLPQVEQKLGMTRTRASTGFWDKDVWFRGKNDVTVIQGDTAYLCDFKTGKSNYEDPFELETNALLLKAKKPGLKKIAGSYCWLKENRMGQLYDLSDFDGTWKRICALMGQIEAKTKTGDFAKHKSGLCGYCSVEDCQHRFVARK